MLHEFDKLIAIAILLYKGKKLFEEDKRNGIKKIGNFVAATYVGQNNPFVYRYLFESVDLIIYTSPEKNRTGVIFNKKVGRDLTNKILDKFVKTFGERTRKLDFTAFIQHDKNEDTSKLLEKIEKFLKSELKTQNGKES